MDVLIVSVGRDYANLSYVFQKSLQEVGVDALAIVKGSKRKERAKVVVPQKFSRYYKDAKIIIFMHSIYQKDSQIKNKRLFVFHGGGRYRFNADRINRIFNPVVEKSLIQTGDLLGLGSKNEEWLLPAVDIENLKPVYKRKKEKIVVGHFPSSTMVKGSKNINKAIKRLRKTFGDKFKYVFSSQVVPWDKQIQRISKCDIYIEACKPKLRSKGQGRPHIYGEWGVSALEAAALGKVVISHFLSYKRYEKEYGECAIKVANSVDEIESRLKELLLLNNNEFLKTQKSTREWVEKYHSYKAVGERLKKILYEI
ncbi:MAG: hypothetical protein PVG65_02105 [Candidatus Thorarchaeota archaeon]|jgi:hypothetical protein